MIDAHQHFWQLSQPFDYCWLDNPELSRIRRDYLPIDLKPHLDAVGIKQSIFVQTQHNLEENRWVLAMAEQTDWLAGVVGWVDLASEQCEEQLLEFKDHPKFVGIRHVVQDEPDEDFIIRPEILRGLKVLEKHGVPYDLLFYVQHLKHADQLGRELPQLPMVIDHLSKPKIKAQSMDDWLPQLRAAAKHEHIFCKLSGMITEADWEDWRPADLKPYVEAALEHFGPNRCMYGSDWPVCELAGSYEQVHGALKEVLGSISDAEAHEIFEGTARRFYGIAE
ncbi:MAG: amidohydrolase family protein [Verrucomicrobiota bacterium]|jgi:L-fuconolactonase|nr:amidohydrolase family protein [Verrucomicrobiota bacterium]